MPFIAFNTGGLVAAAGDFLARLENPDVVIAAFVAILHKCVSFVVVAVEGSCSFVIVIRVLNEPIKYHIYPIIYKHKSKKL